MSELCREDQVSQNELLRETPRYHTAMSRKARVTDEWRNIFKRLPWSDGPPNRQSVIFRGQILNHDPSRWTNSDECHGRSCDWSYEEVKIGQERREAWLVRTGFQSPFVCLEELRDKFERTRIAAAHLDTLGTNTMVANRDWTREAFFRNSPAYIATAGYPEAFGRYKPGYFPSSTVTPGMLRTLYSKKKNVGANEAPDGRGPNGEFLHRMLISEQMYNNLLHIDPLFKDMLLELDPGALNESLKINGTNGKRIGNFIPRIIENPRRFKWDPEVQDFVYVNQYIDIDRGDEGVYSRREP